MKLHFKIDTLGKRIGLGYALVVIVLAFAVLVTIWQVAEINNSAATFINSNRPSSRAGLELMNGVNHSIAALRGWILYKRDTFRVERAQAWKYEINKALNHLEVLSGQWTEEQSTEQFFSVRHLLDQLSRHQSEVERLVLLNQDSAITYMEDHVIPLNEEILDLLEAFVSEHETQTLQGFEGMQEQIKILAIIEWFLLGMGVLISAIMAALITSTISRPVANAVEVARDIGLGNLDRDIRIDGLKEMEFLGTALSDMRASLLKKTNETNHYAWLSKGKNDLNDTLRGDKDVIQLANESVAFLARYTKANIGSVYLSDEHEEHFRPVGFYAFGADTEKREFKPGEGLIGQAAADRTIIYLENADTYDLRVRSSVVDFYPKHILAAPFFFEGRIVGVLELGKLDNFTQAERAFIEHNLNDVAVAINSALTRKKIEELLAESELKGKLLEGAKLEIEQQMEGLNAVALVSVTDPNGNIRYVNDRFVKVSGFSREELIGNNHRILKSGKQPDGLFTGMWKAISIGRVWNGEIVNKAKDGSFYWVDTTIIPIVNLEGTIERYLSVRFEITEIKEQQEKLKRLNDELHTQQEELAQTNEELEEQTQKLKEQQEELQAANEELEEQAQIVEQKNRGLEAARIDIELKARQLEVSSKYKSEFLANMSHELRTPLNSLLILSNDLATNKEGNLNDEQVESAQVISKGGMDLLNLINEILDLSKIEAGKMEVDLKETAISEIADNMLRSFRHMASQKGLPLECNIDVALPAHILTDKQRIEQVLKNLVSNAIKFTERGKVSIHFSREAGDHLCIAVQDTGIGIPQDKQQVVFEAFQQADGGTSRKYGGTGLGLSISRELAKLLGGRIILKSAPGQGSTFSLIIPLIGSSSEIRMPEESSISQRTVIEPESRFLNYPTIDDQRHQTTPDNHVILIIEDDPDFAKILGAQANQKGFKFISAATGEDGLSLARQYPLHAIILDLDLPGIDGLTVLRELKADADLRHIPVHIMSVNEKTLDPIRSGAVEYLTKPVTKAQLDDAFGRIEHFVNRKMKNLLLIEDDDNLRQSMMKLIGNGDVKCYEAATGKEALDHVLGKTIDCIVLDIGLPDMTGFELIKEFEKQLSGKIPPIIVYTGKELSKKENEELQQYAETIIVKGVKSEERLLDETALFLHRTVRNLPPKKQEMIAMLHNKEAILQSKRVLLVDDDMRNLFALGKVLKEKGMEVVKAENGKVALETLQNNGDIDLILMDVMMPEMDGYTCMREIRKQKSFAKLPIIALTAKAMKDDRQKCIDAGANDYITKPVDMDRLLTLMGIWMKK